MKFSLQERAAGACQDGSVTTEMEAPPGSGAGQLCHSACRPFKAQRVSESDLNGPLLAEWNALHARISPCTPFTSAQWNALWWKHYRSRSRFVHDELCLLVVTDARDALVAVAPMMSTWRPSFGPLRVNTLRYFGADPNVTEIRGLVCEPQNEGDAHEAVREYLSKLLPRSSWVEWGALRRENCAKAARKLPDGSKTSTREIDAYHLELPATWEELRSSRSRNIKESIRKCYNSLKRDGLTPQLRVVQSPQDVAGALQTFFRLHSMRNLATNTVAHADVFQNENDRAFLTEYAHELSRRGQLRIFQLLISGDVVATRVAFQFNDEIYLYYSGYDPTWSKYSVMTTLVVEALKWSIEQRLKVVHLSTGTDVSKLRWSPGVTHYCALTEVRRGWRARLSFGVYQQAQRLASWAGRSRFAAGARR
jgi:CelD/BcsL family acetyltransferase involved in cellulose biosynthesis